MIKPHWMHVLRWALAFALCTTFAPSHAANSCSGVGSLVPSPAFPARIVVTPSVAAGKIIYSTTVAGGVTCTGTPNTYVAFSSAAGLGGPRVVSGVTNVSVTSSLSSIPQGPGYSSARVTSGPCVVSGYSSPTNSPIIKWTGNGTCNINFTVGISFFATNTGAVSGTIPAALSTGFTGSSWVYYHTCDNDSTCSSPSSVTALNTSAQSIPIQALTSTCTLSTPANQFVSLPNVSTSAFQGVGTTVGSTQIAITYNCDNSGGPMSLSMAWTYAPMYRSGTPEGYYGWFSNTGTAAGVAVQIVDSSGRIVNSGPQSQQIASVANGSNTIIYRAMYYQYASTITSGTVNAVAQYTATYN